MKALQTLGGWWYCRDGSRTHDSHLISLRVDLMSTNLASKWEGTPELRRRGARLQLASHLKLYILHPTYEKKLLQKTIRTSHQPATQVQMTGDSVTRDTLKKNASVVEMAISELGCRVGVDVITVHIRAFYELMQLEASSRDLINASCYH